MFRYNTVTKDPFKHRWLVAKLIDVKTDQQTISGSFKDQYQLEVVVVASALDDM